jgi:hypothetical protein
MARFVEMAHHMGADEARGTGDENRKRGHAGRCQSVGILTDRVVAAIRMS